jgi:predicted HAD superfamily Cof-like phosphohydrolase
MSLEETSEWLEAHAADDLEAAKDAWGDRCYVLIGDAVSAGLSVEAIFTAVHISNMTKRGINPINGKAIKSEDFQRPKLS